MTARRIYPAAPLPGAYNEPMRLRAALSLAIAATVAGGCASVLGVDHSYELEDGGASDDATAMDGADAPGDRGADGNTGDVRPGDGPASDRCLAKEDCTNGVDDDCNGKTDCADPMCGAYSCVPPVPPGWSGPAELFDQMGNPVPPSCDALHSGPVADGTAGLAFAPASCSACSCGAPNTTCTATFTPYSDAACSMMCSPSVMLPANTCVDMPFGNCATTNDWSNTAPVLGGGSCPPSGGIPAVTPPTWGEVGRACAVSATGGGCSSGDVCAATATAKFSSGACIFQSGDVSCPGAGYTVKHTLYAGDSDTRGCDACACGAQQGGSCTFQGIQFFTNTGCQGNSQMHGIHPCYNGNATNSGSVMSKAQVTPGTCPPSGGSPNGTVSPTTPTTVCCTQ